MYHRHHLNQNLFSTREFHPLLISHFNLQRFLITNEPIIGKVGKVLGLVELRHD